MMNHDITPVSSFQRVVNTSPLRTETRAAIQNTVLQFYVKNQPQEDDTDGITACYERLSQEDKLEGESNSIVNQKKFWKNIAAITAIQLSATMMRTTGTPGRISTGPASSGCLPI